jgi:hypothetical protein
MTTEMRRVHPTHLGQGADAHRPGVLMQPRRRTSDGVKSFGLNEGSRAPNTQPVNPREQRRIITEPNQLRRCQTRPRGDRIKPSLLNARGLVAQRSGPAHAQDEPPAARTNGVDLIRIARQPGDAGCAHAATLEDVSRSGEGH